MDIKRAVTDGPIEAVTDAAQSIHWMTLVGSEELRRRAGEGSVESYHEIRKLKISKKALQSLSPWASISLSTLHAEIARRQASGERPECGSGANTHGYNTGLHVGALFLILLLSTLACSFPIVVRRFPKLPVPNYSLFLSRHFGTGVLIATAFVHLLPTAFTSLTDSCLPRFWNEVYPAIPGFIAMVSVLVVVGIEMFFATKGAGHSHSMDMESLRPGQQEARLPYKRSSSMSRFRHEPLGYNEIDDDEDEDMTFSDQRDPESPSTLNKPLPSTPSVDNDSDMDLDELEAEEDTRPLNSSPNGRKLFLSDDDSRRPASSRQVSFADPVESDSRSSAEKSHSEQRMVLQCLLLEAGILFHSVFIGMALSVSTGPAFIVLLIAISFHQTFEGLAVDDVTHVRNNHAHRPSHRPRRAQAVRPRQPIWPADRGHRQRHLQRLVTVRGARAAARGRLPDGPELQGAQGTTATRGLCRGGLWKHAHGVCRGVCIA
nr:zinc-regulated transporter 2 [Quercus suber]